jgi:hypothetical protein
VIPLLVSLSLLLAVTQDRKMPKPPEAFSATAQLKTADTAGAAFLRIFIDKYTTDHDRDTLVEALKLNGYPSFLEALRKAPVVGRLEVGKKTWPLRWARQEATPTGRVIVVATDQPVIFLGGSAPDAKPREGYGLALVQFEVDDVGMGKGKMAGAAKVKPGNPTGVQIDDYGTTPIQLTSVTKIIS